MTLKLVERRARFRCSWTWGACWQRWRSSSMPHMPSRPPNLSCSQVGTFALQQFPSSRKLLIITTEGAEINMDMDSEGRIENAEMNLNICDKSTRKQNIFFRE